MTADPSGAMAQGFLVSSSHLRVQPFSRRSVSMLVKLPALGPFMPFVVGAYGSGAAKPLPYKGSPTANRFAGMPRSTRYFMDNSVERGVPGCFDDAKSGEWWPANGVRSPVKS